MIARRQSAAAPSDSVPWHRREPPAGPEWRDAGWDIARLTADGADSGRQLELTVDQHDADAPPSRLTMRLAASSLRPVAMRVEGPGPMGESTMRFAFGSRDFTEVDSSEKATGVIRSSGDVPAGAYLSESLDLLVRALPLADGYRTTAQLLLPMSRRVETIGVRVDGRDTVATRAGRTAECWRVAVTSERAPTTWFWIAPVTHELMRIAVKDADGRVTVMSR
jgi:hypothetical protein